MKHLENAIELIYNICKEETKFYTEYILIIPKGFLIDIQKTNEIDRMENGPYSEERRENKEYVEYTVGRTHGEKIIEKNYNENNKDVSEETANADRNFIRNNHNR